MFSEKISSMTFVTTNDSALIFIVIEVITFMKCKYRDLVRLTLAALIRQSFVSLCTCCCLHLSSTEITALLYSKMMMAPQELRSNSDPNAPPNGIKKVKCNYPICLDQNTCDQNETSRFLSYHLRAFFYLNNFQSFFVQQKKCPFFKTNLTLGMAHTVSKVLFLFKN